MSVRRLRLLAVTFLLAEGLGALAWWLVLLQVPRSRAAFLAPGAPESGLLAFWLPDLLLYVGAAFAAAIGIAGRNPWGWGVLCVHCGAAAYAALYAISLALLSGGGWWGACLMAPSLACLPYLTWRLRPVGQPC